MESNNLSEKLPKKPTVLVSAFACAPNRGSEPGTGWNWVNQIANHGHKTIAVVDKRLQKEIETYCVNNSIPKNLKFYFFGLPDCLSLNKYIHYITWQLLLFIYVLLKVKEPYDIIHHVTLSTIRFPTSITLLPKPFILGPCAGGESCSANLVLYCASGIKDYAHYHLRNITQTLIWINPLQLFNFYKAKCIFLTTPQAKQYMPKVIQKKTTVSTNIGIETKPESQKNKKDDEIIRLLFVGRFIYWKGLRLCLESFQLASKKIKNIELTLIGDGSYKNYIESYIKQNNLCTKIKIINWMPQDKLFDEYANADIFLFPSLHDSSANVILEAFSSGLPVICLDNAGPGFLVDSSSGLKVTIQKKSPKEVVKDLSNKIIELVNNEDLRKELAQGAFQRSKSFTWEALYNNVYKESDLLI